MDVKFRARLGPDNNDDKAVRILNRVIEWSSEGLRYEADQRHGELIVKDVGLKEGSKTVNTPGLKNAVDKDAVQGVQHFGLPVNCSSWKLSCTRSLGHPVCHEGNLQEHVVTHGQ